MPIAPTDLPREARRTVARLTPRLQRVFKDEPVLWPPFLIRLERELPRLLDLMHRLYGWRYDFHWHLEQVLLTAARAWRDRSEQWRAWDAEEEAAAAAGHPWFHDNRQVGAVAYVDRFARDLEGLRERLPYLDRLGVTYLHLMPLLRARAGESDGGYAVSSYREVEPRLGTMPQLAQLATELRQRGVRLCLDFVFNHTADDHDWALAAKAGDTDKQDYYWMFDDRTVPDRLSPTLREIFPDRGGDAFTFVPELGKHVWTTFNTYQWDLNFSNPALFRQMAEEMLFLANQGVSVLRLDAVPFIWKREGTDCENQPEAHWIIQAFNAIGRIAAPGLVFKSEAIVHPDQVASYVAPHEAQVSYNPLLMVLLWESLATRDTRLMRHSLIKRFGLPDGAGWMTYIRCHDDIGWGFADEDAAECGINGFDHRQFLNAFYTGRFPGSFARGLPFQENLRTRDMRISGSLASLTGLEAARAKRDRAGVDRALARIRLLHGIILTIGGVPLIYLGDELAVENDYAFADDPHRRNDNRWAHRPVMDWQRAERDLADPTSPAARTTASLQRLIAVRTARTELAGPAMAILPVENPHVLAYRRGEGERPLVILANMTEAPQTVGDTGLVSLLGPGPWRELVGETSLAWDPGVGVTLPAYGFWVLASG